MRGDFHTHSTLDDGKSSLEEMAAAARAAGLTSILSTRSEERR